MANIDSANKRRAAMMIAPIPDGDISSTLDRRQICMLYRMATAEPAPSLVPTSGSISDLLGKNASIDDILDNAGSIANSAKMAGSIGRVTIR